MSTVINVEEDMLVNALKKASITAKDGYMVSIDPSRKDGDGKVFGSLTSFDGNTQIVSHFTAKVPEGVKAFSVCTGTEFYNVVMAMSELKKDISIEIAENDIKLVCGAAKTAIGRKETIEMFEIKADKEQYCVQLKLNEFKKTVLKGSYCPSREDSRGFRNMLQLTPICPSMEDAKLRMVTSDGYCIAICDGAVNAISKEQDAQRSYGVACDRMRVVAGLCGGDEVNVFFSKNQVVIVNENDFYIFRTFLTAYPASVGRMIDKPAHACNVTLDAKELDTALSLALITNGDMNPVVLELSGKNLIVSDSFGKSRTEIMVEPSGDIEEAYCCNASFLKTAVIKAASEKVALGFDGAAMPLYVRADGQNNAVGIIAPVHQKEDKDKIPEKSGK